jgi:hypothetical protein
MSDPTPTPPGVTRAAAPSMPVSVRLDQGAPAGDVVPALAALLRRLRDNARTETTTDNKTTRRP